MSDVLNIKWQTTSSKDEPEWVELTLAGGRVVRYYPSRRL